MKFGSLIVVCVMCALPGWSAAMQLGANERVETEAPSGYRGPDRGRPRPHGRAGSASHEGPQSLPELLQIGSELGVLSAQFS